MRQIEWDQYDRNVEGREGVEDEGRGFGIAPDIEFGVRCPVAFAVLSMGWSWREWFGRCFYATVDISGSGHVPNSAPHDGETFDMCAYSGEVPKEKGDVRERSSRDDPDCVDRFSEDVFSNCDNALRY